MKITKAGIDSALTVVAAVAAAVLPILINAGDISASTGAAIGAGIAAIVGGYHGGATVQAKRGTSSPPAADTPTDGAGVTVAGGDPLDLAAA